MEVGGESAATAIGLFLLLTVLQKKKKCLVKSQFQIDYSSLVLRRFYPPFLCLWIHWSLAFYVDTSLTSCVKEPSLSHYVVIIPPCFISFLRFTCLYAYLLVCPLFCSTPSIRSTRAEILVSMPGITPS